MSTYRVMVEGEDGLVFCTEDNLKAGTQTTTAARSAYEDYPEAREIWCERDDESFSILQSYTEE